MATPERFLSAPIPGQSLTDTPRNYKWERPPQMSDYEEVTRYYINKLADQDVMDDLSVMFDNGMPISPFVESLTTSGVVEGLHSIDVSLLVGPVIHAFIKAAMLEYGIDAKDDIYDPEKDPSEREKRRLMTAIELALADAEREDRTSETDPGVSVLSEVRSTLIEEGAEEPESEGMQEDMPEEEETPQEEPMGDDTPAPMRGLMAQEPK